MQFELLTERPNLWPILLLIIIGVISIILFNGINKFLFPLIKVDSIKNNAKNNFIKIQRIYWPLFMLIGFGAVVKTNPFFGGITILAIMIGGWSFIRNYTLGLIILLSNHIKVGQNLIVQEHKGTVMSLRKTFCELRTNNNEVIMLPYLKFQSAAVLKANASEKYLTKDILLLFPKTTDFLDQKEKIKSELLSSPWLVSFENSSIELIKETKTEFKVKVIVHGINREHLLMAENQLKKAIN